MIITAPAMYLASNVRVATRRRPSAREDDDRRISACFVISNAGLAVGLRRDSMVLCGRDVAAGEGRALRFRASLRDSRAGHALAFTRHDHRLIGRTICRHRLRFSCVILFAVDANFDASHV
jgi:hypothetical protein